MNEIFDIAIVGAGPAGITAAIYALRAGLKTVIFDGGVPGGTLNRLERIENYPGFESNTGKKLSDIMLSQLYGLGGKIIPRYVSNVISGSPLTLVSGNEIYSAKFTVLAMGVKRKTPEFLVGYKGKGVSYCAVCDGNFFKGKAVAVIGEGKEAQEDAAYLTGICDKVYLITKNSSLSAPKGVTKISAEVDKIIGETSVEGLSFGENSDMGLIKVEGVFVAMGAFSAEEIVSGLKTENSFVKADSLGKTNYDNIYAVGDIAFGSLKQVVWACGSAAVAASDIVKKIKA